TRRARAVPDPCRRRGRGIGRVRRTIVVRRMRRARGDDMNLPGGPVFDARPVRRAFSRASAGYASAAELQRDIEARLLESLDYLDDRVPEVVLDVGSGPGHAAQAMRRRWPKARIVALDLSLPMLRQARPRDGWNPLRKPLDR